MGTAKDFRFSKEHEWVKVEGDKVRVGISDFAQSELGDIVFVELPEVGKKLQVNEPFGSVESVKTVSELYAPISGTIIEVNEQLTDSPELVNEFPYDQAWMVIIKPDDLSELETLMTADEYDQMINEAE